jgi:hypothetical protein
LRWSEVLIKRSDATGEGAVPKCRRISGLVLPKIIAICLNHMFESLFKVQKELKDNSTRTQTFQAGCPELIKVIFLPRPVGYMLQRIKD